LGAAVMAPALVPLSALGRGGVRAPSERINMAFVGLGPHGTRRLFGAE